MVTDTTSQSGLMMNPLQPSG